MRVNEGMLGKQNKKYKALWVNTDQRVRMLELLLLGGSLLGLGASRALRSSSSIRHIPLAKESKSNDPD